MQVKVVDGCHFIPRRIAGFFAQKEGHKLRRLFIYSLIKAKWSSKLHGLGGDKSEERTS